MALGILATVAPEEAVKGFADALQTNSASEFRHEALSWLSDTLGYGGEDLLAALTGDPDEWIALKAAQELARHGDRRGFDALVRIVVADDERAVWGLDTLMRSARSEHLADAERLLRGTSEAERRVGARLLMVCEAPNAVDVASGLLNDPDPTVRCASAWLLAHRGRADALLSRVDQFLGDTEHIAGPPLDEPRGPVRRTRPVRQARRVRCCADVVYRWFAARPAVLQAAIAGREDNVGF